LLKRLKSVKELKELAIKQIEENLKDKRFDKIKPLLVSGDIEGSAWMKDLG